MEYLIHKGNVTSLDTLFTIKQDSGSEITC